MNGSRSRTGNVPGTVSAPLRPSWAGRHRQSAGKSGGTGTRVGVTARTMRRRRPGSSRKGPQHHAGTVVVQRGESVMRIPSPASHGCLRSAGQHRRCRSRRNVRGLFGTRASGEAGQKMLMVPGLTGVGSALTPVAAAAGPRHAISERDDLEDPGGNPQHFRQCRTPGTRIRGPQYARKLSAARTTARQLDAVEEAQC